MSSSFQKMNSDIVYFSLEYSALNKICPYEADFQAICFILWERYFKGRKMFLMFLQNPLNDFIK